jgi:D-tyrosyl-tRNA(Tyr) deacylase
LRFLIQRVTQSQVYISNKQISDISGGLLIFIGISHDDTDSDITYLVEKTLNLRLFPSLKASFEYSAMETSAELLLVSQFTLYSDTRRGRRPSFLKAGTSENAKELYLKVIQLFKQSGLKVATGMFGAKMMVQLENDGPVTLLLDSLDKTRSRRS